MSDTTRVILSIVGATLVSLVPVVRAWVLTKLTPERLSQVQSIARGAVRAAEKLATDLKDAQGVGVLPAGAISWGDAKLQYAQSVVIAGAKRLGLKLTANEVQAFIHQALAEVDTIAAAGSLKAA
jgi:hypothetical protein